MTAISTCPDESELLPVATGEPAGEAIERHLDACPICAGRVELLRAELTSLRQDLEGGMTPPSTEPDPAVNHDGEPSSGGTTFAWPADPAGDAAPEPAGPAAVAAARAAAEGRTERPGAIGRYLVVDQLDVGAQGQVFRVIHPNLGQDMVLKLGRKPVGADERTSLIAEGRLLADLKPHINLVRIYDLDFHNDRPFLVMEYVHGRNLEDYARDEPVTPRRAAELVAKLAGALAMVHRKGVVHRDIKPRNILIDEMGEPRLIDFGLARLRNAWSDPSATTWGGTLAFMAPEQARLEHDRTGPKSDIFGLGAVLYFLLTGQAPFVGETQDEIWEHARRCEFEPRALRIAKVPRRLERICLKALAADPADRYATAEAFEKALKRYLIRPKVLGALAGGSGLVLLGSLVFAQVWHRPDHITSQNHHMMIPTARPAPGALEGDLTVRVWSEAGGKRGLKIDEPGALPLLAGEKVHLQAQVNQPAHLYLFWLDSQGHVSLLYPRDDGKFGSRPSGDSARETVHSPEALDEGHRMSGPGGLETVLLLARRTPLPAGTDLAGLIGPLPSSPLRDVQEVAVRGFDEGQLIGALRLVQHRGIDEQADKIDDPLLQLMERLRTQNDFVVIKAVRFAYQGEQSRAR
jgi:predicted Ser/Thr protein kinase